MLLIAHRGNLMGHIIDKENSPEYVSIALKRGYDAEVDVWYINGEFFLGHDKPKTKTDSSFLTQRKIWCHAKNIDALNHLLNIGAHCFAHDMDKAALTSQGFIWSFSNEIPTERSIAVLPEIYGLNITGFYGVCTDFVASYE